MGLFGPTTVRMLVAASLLLVGSVAAQAAGALAIGACGAYGFAYDYERNAFAAAEAEALRKCAGRGCRIVTAVKRNCAAFAVDGRNFCGSYGYASAARLGQAQNTGAIATAARIA
jgi:hypothetical protein